MVLAPPIGCVMARVSEALPCVRDTNLSEAAPLCETVDSITLPVLFVLTTQGPDRSVSNPGFRSKLAPASATVPSTSEMSSR